MRTRTLTRRCTTRPARIDRPQLASPHYKSSMGGTPHPNPDHFLAGLTRGHGGGCRGHPEARGGGLPGRPLRGAAGEAGPVLAARHHGRSRRPRHEHGVRLRRHAPVRLPRHEPAASARLSQSIGKCIGCYHQKLQVLFGIGFSNDQCWYLLIWRLMCASQMEPSTGSLFLVVHQLVFMKL